MSIRIKQGHYYVITGHPGISGFKDYSRTVECIVASPRAKRDRINVDREYLATGLGKFRINDGHLPDYQPVVSEVEMLCFLDANPFQEAVKL